MITCIKIKNFLFVLYKTWKFGFLRFDEGLNTSWWLNIGPLAIIKENKKGENKNEG